MVKRKLFKRMAALASVAVMVMGLVINVMAIEESYSDSESAAYDIGNDGEAEFLIKCSFDDGSAYASTTVYTAYEEDCVEAYVFLELYGVTGSGGYGFIDDESSKETNGSARYAYADVTLFGIKAPYIDFSASSWHTGTVDDNSVSDYLTAGY